MLTVTQCKCIEMGSRAGGMRGGMAVLLLLLMLVRLTLISGPFYVNDNVHTGGASISALHPQRWRSFGACTPGSARRSQLHPRVAICRTYITADLHGFYN